MNFPTQTDSAAGSLTARYAAAARVGAFLNKVYMWMGFGLLATAIACYWAVHSVMFMSWLAAHPGGLWLLIGAELLLVVILTAAAGKLSVSAARGLFLVYSLVSGVTLGPVVNMFTSESLTVAFVTTAGTFGAMSLIGYTTKKDMSTWGRTLLMILVGLILAILVNFFVGSSTLDWIISGIGVLLFSVLTAYDTQRLKSMALAEGPAVDKAAVYGALMLYLDFINLFLYLLRFLGRAKN